MAEFQRQNRTGLVTLVFTDLVDDEASVAIWVQLWRAPSWAGIDAAEQRKTE